MDQLLSTLFKQQYFLIPEKLNSNLQTNDFYFPPKTNADLTFQVRHYAGKVQYSAKGFLEKNRSTHSSGNANNHLSLLLTKA